MDLDRRSKSAGRPRSSARRRSSNRSLSPERMRDDASSRKSRKSSRHITRESFSSKRPHQYSSSSRRHVGHEASPGSMGIANNIVGVSSISPTRQASGLGDFLRQHESPKSTKSGASSIHSNDSRKARSIFSKHRSKSKRSSKPPKVIDEAKSMSASSGEHGDFQEFQQSKLLFQAMSSGDWRQLYKCVTDLKESFSDDKITRILSLSWQDDDQESTLLHMAVWKAPPALTKAIMDIIPSSQDASSLYTCTDADGNTPLHLCCANLPLDRYNKVDTSVLKRLANSAPTALRLANEYGDTPMHMLVSSEVCCEDASRNEEIACEAVSTLVDIDENVCRLQDATGALPLHIAIGCGAHEGVLMKLLEAAPTVATAKDEVGMLPLHYCAAYGKTPLSVVDLLMEAYPESFTEVTVNGDTPLHILASNASTSMASLSTQRMNVEQEGMIQLLLGSSVREDDALSRATDEESVISYGGHRRPLLACNKEKMNPLHCCALFNAPAQVPRLLMKNPLGARAAIMKNEFGATPLHVACAQPAVADSVTQVASLGTATSASALDRHRRTPLHVACQNSHATGDLIRVLSNLFPEALKEQTQRGHLPLHLAAQSQVKESVIEALLAAYPEAAMVKNKSSNTPLHDASKYRASVGVVELLLDSYPDAVYIQNQYGNLPLHCATAYQAPAEVVNILLKAWPDGASMQNRNKDAPLHYAAAYTTSLDVLRPLIDAAPAAVLLLNSSNQTPIDRAKSNNAPANVVALLEAAADQWTQRANTDRWGQSYASEQGDDSMTSSVFS